MANFNKVILAGNVTRDPQLSYLPSNTPVCEFGLAVNRKWKSQTGEMKEDTCFVELRAFGKPAETLNQYVTKGKPLLVEGKLRYDQWEGKDGQKRSRLYVVIDTFQFLGSPGGGSGGGGRPAARGPGREVGGDADEAPPIQEEPVSGGSDIPF